MKWYEVLITFNDGSLHCDEIQGKSPRNGLKNARVNWPDAVHIILRY